MLNNVRPVFCWMHGCASLLGSVPFFLKACDCYKIKMDFKAAHDTQQMHLHADYGAWNSVNTLGWQTQGKDGYIQMHG